MESAPPETPTTTLSSGSSISYFLIVVFARESIFNVVGGEACRHYYLERILDRYRKLRNVRFGEHYIVPGRGIRGRGYEYAQELLTGLVLMDARFERPCYETYRINSFSRKL